MATILPIQIYIFRLLKLSNALLYHYSHFHERNTLVPKMQKLTEAILLIILICASSICMNQSVPNHVNHNKVYHQHKSEINHILNRRNVDLYQSKRKLEMSDLDALSDYSLKFIRCQSITSYSSDTDQSAVLSNDDYVVLRLCPVKACYSNFYFGCSSNYGDYLLRLNEYLKILQERHQWCETCEWCSDNLYNDNYTGYVDDNSYDCHAFNETCVSFCNENRVDSEDFFQCDQSNTTDAQGRMMYVGPKCSADYTGIVKSWFYDEDCTLPIVNLYQGNTADSIETSQITTATFQINDCLQCKDNSMVRQFRKLLSAHCQVSHTSHFQSGLGRKQYRHRKLLR